MVENEKMKMISKAKTEGVASFAITNFFTLISGAAFFN
jgi:hypothetical protein